MKFLRLASKAFNILKDRSSKKSSSDGEEATTSSGISKKMLALLLGGGTGCLFFSIACAFIVIIAALIFLDIIKIDDGNGSNGKKICNTYPAIENICDSMTVLDKSGNIIDTVSLDDYVAGVITGEVGGFQDESLNIQKVFAIAARSYGLSRATKSDNNCTIESSDSYQVYKSNYTEAAITAANETSGIVLVKDGSVQATEYDAFCFNSRDTNYYTLCQGEPLKIPTSWVNEHVNGAVCVNKSCIDYKENDGKVSHHGRGMSQYGAYYLSIAENMTYDEILDYFYGKNDITLANLGEEKTTCNVISGGGCYTGPDEYPLSGGTATKLSSTLNTVLSSSDIDDINNGIISGIESAGYGTGEAVAAAATELILGLYNKGYFLPYYYGGGHGSGDNALTIGINPLFGKNTSGSSKNGVDNLKYNLSFDCSGFVSWAIKNAVKSDFQPATSGAFVNYGKNIEFSEVTPGDVFANATHIILVIKNNGDGSVITAESTGSGVIFNRITSSAVNGYSIIDMDDYYEKIKDSSDPYGGTVGSCKNNSSSKNNEKYVLINPSHQVINGTSSSNASFATEKLSMYMFSKSVKSELESRGYNVIVSPSEGSIESGDECWDSSDGSGASGKWSTCGVRQVKYLISQHNDSNTVYIALHSNAGATLYGPAVYYSTANSNSKTFGNKLCSSIKSVYSTNYKKSSGESMFNCLNADTISEPKYYYDNGGKGSAVLIEIGSHENSNNQNFIESNMGDLAKGIADGIDNYFK